MLNVIMLTVVTPNIINECYYFVRRYTKRSQAECRYAVRHYAKYGFVECCYSECRYVECHWAECCGANLTVLILTFCQWPI